MSPILQRLLELSAKPARIVLGLISGTSADAISVAICRIKGGGIPTPGNPGAEVELIQYYEHPYAASVRRQVFGAADLNVRTIAELHVQVGELFADACLSAIQAAKLTPEEIDLIGSHGQTLYHHSSMPGVPRATLQVGDGDQIAERTGICVISDFRSRDIAAGGEGAPLTPFSDLILYAGPAGASANRRRVILNLGGIANVTILDPDPDRVFGFDTGPANSLLDRLAVQLSGGELTCDLDGRLARSGTVNAALLDDLLTTDPFLQRRPPKSTGFEMYGDAFLERAVAAHGRRDHDLMATLTEFTARSITKALDRFVVDPPVGEIIVAGGGARNPALMERIRANMNPVPVRDSEEVGVSSSAREAMAFALFANEALLGHPTSLPSVTGARTPVILGKWSFPSA
ncbi:anhydro-N-acetylmuramic acid kinase [Singulisphaera acidiphila]|uniref:Anhydro-N-acetylmuramic acid kinase n=1 Tax=Singulisphaera acidiphila (strain ATCC BAA-1392 / DSM 18658 / VKM B-2454 / MOB10) TaxID=886293 RepID=L0DJ87_SINAD|nr:anhydro-N-acetylmuramic acid kinase [Singulisphaera acidiphila]AGA28895.1 molecular chaperone [Singulisphaera acidiphila DSM 18658]